MISNVFFLKKESSRISQEGSMGRKVYLPTFIWLIFYGKLVGKYTIQWILWVMACCHGMFLVVFSGLFTAVQPRLFHTAVPTVKVSSHDLRRMGKWGGAVVRSEQLTPRPGVVNGHGPSPRKPTFLEVFMVHNLILGGQNHDFFHGWKDCWKGAMRFYRG